MRKKITQSKAYDVIFRTTIVFITNIMLAMATVWFLEPAKLYAGGATGLAQLIRRIIVACGGSQTVGSYDYLGILIFVINIPFAIIGFKYVSKKFAIYSILAIVVQSVFTTLFQSVSHSSFAELAEPIITANGAIYNYGGVLTLAIFGGLVAGFASGLALKFGTSTGGIDILSQALAIHKNIGIGVFTMVLNVLMAVIGGGILDGAWSIVLFTCVRMILNSLVMDKVHTSYTYTGLHIFSEHSGEISDFLIRDFNRGCTYLNVEGAYSHRKSVEIYCVVSTYQIEKILKRIDEIDPHAFVTMSPVKRIKGNFIKKSII